jgi:UDP-N-acetylglucosamine transferase subunit ALG13
MSAESRVVVSAGSYHLPFERLGAWMQPWVDAHPQVVVVYQHGPGRPIRGAVNRSMIPYGEFLQLCQEASAVVLQGGAGAVMDMRGLRLRPIVVPRVPGNGEVVDDHQLRFTQCAVDLGLVWRATSPEQLASLLDAAVGGTLPVQIDVQVQTPGVAAVERLLSQLPARLPLRRRVTRLAGEGTRLLRYH